MMSGFFITFLKKLFPPRFLNKLRLVYWFFRLSPEYWRDMTRYLRHSGTAGSDTQCKLEAKIIAKYHVLEKGLSMPEPREGFGLEHARTLLDMIEQYVASGYDQSEKQFQVALNVIEKYFEFVGIDHPKFTELRKRFENIKLISSHQDSGAITVTKNEILSAIDKSFDEFVRARYSVRNYSNSSVDKNHIERAISIAIKTPSVCNRQSWHVHSLVKDEQIAAVLEIQGGNRGFGHLVKHLLIVTTDLQTFEGIGERNQSYIDGGMFAMSLLYALHSQGLGACALNWSVGKEKDIQIRKLVSLKKCECIIMMISVGNLPESLSVARSSRRELGAIYECHK